MDSFVWAGRQSDDAILYVANESQLLIQYQGRLAGRSVLCSDDSHLSQERESRQNEVKPQTIFRYKYVLDQSAI